MMYTAIMLRGQECCRRSQNEARYFDNHDKCYQTISQ